MYLTIERFLPLTFIFIRFPNTKSIKSRKLEKWLRENLVKMLVQLAFLSRFEAPKSQQERRPVGSARWELECFESLWTCIWDKQSRPFKAFRSLLVNMKGDALRRQDRVKYFHITMSITGVVLSIGSTTFCGCSNVLVTDHGIRWRALYKARTSLPFMSGSFKI